MGCGCKEKKRVQAQEPARVILRENDNKTVVPPPVPSSPEEVNKIVNKLNDILTP